MATEIWGQDSAIKGLRFVEFERITEGRHQGHLRWIKTLGLDDLHAEYHFIYSEDELVRNGWEQINV